MGRIVASVKIESFAAPEKGIRCDALVDTGASHMVLPTAWRDRLGDLEEMRRLELETATQTAVEVVFVDMEPEDGEFEPLIGYLVLEQSQAAVDILGHRLVYVKRLDLK